VHFINIARSPKILVERTDVKRTSGKQNQSKPSGV
jgi:hypothetical protein